MGDLQENLHNVEDKLGAAETCKTMLNEEVLALRQAYDKLSSDLEVSQSYKSVCLSVCHTRDPCLNGSRCRNTFHFIRQ